MKPDDARAVADAPEARAHFRRTLIRVLAVQAVSLLLLWWLQWRYHS
jgi:hypothetical protein